MHSTAILVGLQPHHVVFADTGDEHPQTYEYIERVAIPYIAGYGGQFHIVYNENWDSLKHMALHDRMVPARTHRWCSAKFKVQPIRAWLEEDGRLPCRQMIGFDANEGHRAKSSGDPRIENVFPLIERGFDRPACKRIIADAGLPIPRRSGCFYCPFQSKGQWIELKREHPKLFQIAVAIERNGAKFEQGFFLAGPKPLEEYIRSGRIRFIEEQNDLGLLRCACYDGDMTAREYKRDIPISDDADDPRDPDRTELPL